jgi:hypothetical protein
MVFSPADFLLWTRCRRQWVHSAIPDGQRYPILPREMTGEANLRETARVIALGIETRSPAARNAAAATLGERDGPPVAAVAHLVLDSERLAEWMETTTTLLADHRPLGHALFVGAGCAVVADLVEWHPRLEGWKVTLFRPGTGLRGVYAVEAALVAFVLGRLGVPLVELEIAYLEKGWRIDGAETFQGLFRGSNLVGRAGKRSRFIEDELRDLEEAALSGTVGSEYRCAQGCNLCVPRGSTASGGGADRDGAGAEDGADVPEGDDAAGAGDDAAGAGDDAAGEEAPSPVLADGRYSVFTLHKGSQLARELVREGITDIREVDATARRISAKQRIQIEAVLADRLYVNRERLARFLDRLVAPLFFLDFEAYAPSVPAFSGLSPYEHVPVIASVHIRRDRDEEVRHDSFVSTAGSDSRGEMFRWLQNLLGEEGSIVVFSKGFESAMVRQMARRTADAEAGERLVERMVDLLDPFAEFAVYHPDQRGKVSLKRVLPAYTDAHYEESPLADGMHANLAYTRWADRALIEAGTKGTGFLDDAALLPGAMDAAVGAATAAESVSAAIDIHGRSGSARVATVDEIATYCAVDTIAMVHLVRRLEDLLAEADDA